MSFQTMTNPDVLLQRDRLLDTLRGYESCVVALSAGVDSAVAAKAAQLALGERAVAITGRSPSLARGELEQAIELARLIEIEHHIIDTDEFSRSAYLQNGPDRCYHCKTELYTQLERWCIERGIRTVVNGANLDDADDYRPGMRAASEHFIRSPLMECGLTKANVRQLAHHWQLPLWDKPATPCLSSRVAYGEEVTPARLGMIDRAERYLRSQGLREVRVRYHRGDLARIELPLSALTQFCELEARKHLVEQFKSFGFQYVTLDLEGFRSGSLNSALIQIAPLAHE